VLLLKMSYSGYGKKGCYKCGDAGHIAESCPSTDRLCYNCRQPGHESSACPSPRTVNTKQCYGCGGVGHVQSDCATLKRGGGLTGGGGGMGNKCYNCGRFGHIAKYCTSASGVSRPPPPGRSLNTSTIPAVKCYRCGGLNHMAKDCLAAPGTTISDQTVVHGGAGGGNEGKTCYKCQQKGHIARDCPQAGEAEYED